MTSAAGHPGGRKPGLSPWAVGIAAVPPAELAHQDGPPFGRGRGTALAVARDTGPSVRGMPGTGVSVCRAAAGHWALPCRTRTASLSAQTGK